MCKNKHSYSKHCAHTLSGDAVVVGNVGVGIPLEVVVIGGLEGHEHRLEG